jgi:hypothetical protein
MVQSQNKNTSKRINGTNHSFETPLFAENILEQTRTLGRVCTIDAVITEEDEILDDKNVVVTTYAVIYAHGSAYF